MSYLWKETQLQIEGKKFELANLASRCCLIFTIRLICFSVQVYRAEIRHILPQIKILDGVELDLENSTVIDNSNMAEFH